MCFHSTNMLPCRPECGRVMIQERVSDRVTETEEDEGWRRVRKHDVKQCYAGRNAAGSPESCRVLKHWAAGLDINWNFLPMWGHELHETHAIFFYLRVTLGAEQDETEQKAVRAFVSWRGAGGLTALMTWHSLLSQSRPAALDVDTH